jgi:hypothetical protein
MTRTTVVCVKNLPAQAKAALLADPAFVYVGRAVVRAGWKASVWANPFKVGMTWADVAAVSHDLRADPSGLAVPDAHTAVCLFLSYMATRGDLLDRLPELKGMRLGCWCRNWKPGDPDYPCHAIRLTRWADVIDVPDIRVPYRSQDRVAR